MADKLAIAGVANLRTLEMDTLLWLSARVMLFVAMRHSVCTAKNTEVSRKPMVWSVEPVFIAGPNMVCGLARWQDSILGKRSPRQARGPER